MILQLEPGLLDGQLFYLGDTSKPYTGI